MDSIKDWPVYDKEPDGHRLGFRYILKGGCTECGSDLAVVAGASIWCTRVRFVDGTVAPDSPCDNAIMAG